MPARTPTDLLIRHVDGDRTATRAIARMVQQLLRSLWRGRWNTAKPHLELHPPSWLDAIYVELIDTMDVDWADRNAFYAIGSQALHELLTHPLQRPRAERLVLVEEWKLTNGRRLPYVRFLQELEGDFLGSEDRAEVLKLRVYAGLSIEGIAQVLNRPVRAIHLRWRQARDHFRSQFALEE